MKRILKITFFAAALLLLTSFVSHGSEGYGGEYLISQDGEEYILSVYNDGAFVPVLRSEFFAELTDYINARSEDVSLVFRDVSTSEDFELSKNGYSISGSLTVLFGGSMSISSDTVISDLNLILSNTPLRIKDGRVEFSSGKITSSTSAVILDYSAGAKFIMSGGAITASSDTGAIQLNKGSAAIIGGSIVNRGGAAIKSKSTLMLSGKPAITGADYGIITDTPITLSYLESEYSGAVSVKFLDSFTEGSISCVFYSATEKALENIDLCDINGNIQPVRYFDSYKGVSERRFGAVYLPYNVDFYCGELLFDKKEFIIGAVIEAPSAAEKVGYEFVGWCADEELSELYDFAKPITKSMKLYAKYRLLPPSFSLSSLGFIYDGEEHSFGITSISHPLFESAVINYRWFRDGLPVSDSGPQIMLSRVSESGEYKCRVSFTYGTDSVTLETPEVSVNIKKATVSIPEILPKYYNGEYQSPDVYATSFYSVDGNGGTVTGIYPVKLVIKDFENCEFPGGKDVAYVDFQILKSENFWTDELSVFDIYEGMTPSHKAASRFGEAEFLYSVEESGVYTEAKPEAPGTYYCIARVSGCENYSELVSNPVRFCVIKEEITGLSIKNLPDKSVYSAFEDFSSAGLLLNVTYNSARVEVISGEKISFKYQSADNFRYGDNAVIAYYLDVAIPIPVTVLKAEYDVSEIVFGNATFVYDGRDKTLEFFGTLPMGLDGIPLSASVSGGGVDAGEYSVVLTFYSSSKNYKIPEPREAWLTIAPFESQVVFSKTDFVYDGEQKCPSAYYTDILGRKILLSVSGARSLAGEYTATATGTDKNYKLIGSETVFVIAKADYDFSGAVWSEGDFVYDGEEKSVSISGLPEGVSVIGYSDNKATSAGKYIAKVTLLYDEANYNPPQDIVYEWEIAKADYDISGFHFEGAEYTFSGETRYPVFVGKMPMGIDGIGLEYSFSGGVTHVSEGRRRIEIKFSTKSPNYNIPESQYAEVEIKPLGITVTWSKGEFTYDMTEHSPSAKAAECEISVVGAKRDAGTHTATGVALNSDYYVINSTYEYKINRAENLWISGLEISDLFDGKLPMPNAESLGGEVYYVYYDSEGEELSDVPTAPGAYYVQARTDGGINYLSLESEKKSFKIIAIIPISMSVILTKNDFAAFDRITPDNLSLILTNNDGSVTELCGEEAVIIYQSADSLRYGDSYFRVGYLDFSEKVEITVRKADYDLSGVFWVDNEQIYDGAEKVITLDGLPDGVEILEYIGGRGIFAGEYPVSVRLGYDAENYNPPVIQDAVLVIKKQVLSVPTVPGAVYNGKEQSPYIPEGTLYKISALSVREVGIYPVKVTPLDSDNYEFPNSETELTLFFELTPRKITVKLSDVDKYPLSSMPKPSYVITDGNLAEGDGLKLEFIYDGDEVSCKSLDLNYELTVENGKIIRHKSLAANTVFLISLISLGAIALILAAAVLIVRRREVALYISRLKCRLSKAESGEAVKKNEIISVEQEKIEDVMSVNAERANELITDSLAKDLLRRQDERVITEGSKKRIINVDTLSENFSSDERVDVNLLKGKNLIPYDTAYIKVLARGVIDKPLKVYANDFSLAAVKMIALTGGEAIKVVTVKKKKGANGDEFTEKA